MIYRWIMKMKKFTSFKLKLAVASVLGLVATKYAKADLLLHEPFNYTSGTPSGPTLNGFQLTGQNGGIGMTGSWTGFTNSGSGPTNVVTVYPGGSNPGVNLNNTGPVVLAYDGTVANLPYSGGFVGMGGSNSTDHMTLSRPLSPSVTSTFVDGATTWFSFVSVRGYVANPAGMKLALGKGALINGRGLTSTGEAIGGGGGLGSAVKNGYKVYPQFWDSVTGSPDAGAEGGTFGNYDVVGLQPDSATTVALSAPYAAEGYDSTPVGQIEGLQAMLLHHEDADGPGGNPPAQPNGARNIIVGKIEWNDGSPDVITTVAFETSESLTEAAFNAFVAAQPLLSSANWSGIKPDLNQSQFDTITLAGGKWFADEIRLATTFDEVVGVVPEPTSVSLMALGLCGLASLRRRRA
jgi:hypothetical protein